MSTTISNIRKRRNESKRNYCDGGIYFEGHNHGFDVKNEKYGNMFDLGIIDPLKVTKNALINASSVATTILSTNAIITMARTYDNK